MKTEPAQVIAGRASGVEQAVYVSAFQFIDIMMHNCTPAIMFDKVARNSRCSFLATIKFFEGRVEPSKPLQALTVMSSRVALSLGPSLAGAVSLLIALFRSLVISVTIGSIDYPMAHPGLPISVLRPTSSRCAPLLAYPC